MSIFIAERANTHIQRMFRRAEDTNGSVCCLLERKPLIDIGITKDVSLLSSSGMTAFQFRLRISNLPFVSNLSVNADMYKQKGSGKPAFLGDHFFKGNKKSDSVVLSLFEARHYSPKYNFMDHVMDIFDHVAKKDPRFLEMVKQFNTLVDPKCYYKELQFKLLDIFELMKQAYDVPSRKLLAERVRSTIKNADIDEFNQYGLKYKLKVPLLIYENGHNATIDEIREAIEGLVPDNI
jgi:hypothetical protein